MSQTRTQWTEQIIRTERIYGDENNTNKDGHKLNNTNDQMGVAEERDQAKCSMRNSTQIKGTSNQSLIIKN